MKKKTEKLFSYGTLQYEKVQMETFGRRLTGKDDVLPGYKLSKVKITDPAVIAKSGEEIHSIVQYTGDPRDQIIGVAFDVSHQELLKADEYEVDDYKRVQVQLQSGASAWVYVSSTDGS